MVSFSQAFQPWQILFSGGKKIQTGVEVAHTGHFKCSVTDQWNRVETPEEYHTCTTNYSLTRELNFNPGEKFGFLNKCCCDNFIVA